MREFLTNCTILFLQNLSPKMEIISMKNEEVDDKHKKKAKVVKTIFNLFF